MTCRGGALLDYKGGEFVGIASRAIAPLLEEYGQLWPLNYARYEQKAFKLTEEAHFLSTLYWRLGYTNSLANGYIKRMWTAIQYDNVEKEDADLAIWHLPAEKKYGFTTLFAKLAAEPEMSRNEYLRLSDRVMGVTAPRAWRKARRAVAKVFGAGE